MGVDCQGLVCGAKPRTELRGAAWLRSRTGPPGPATTTPGTRAPDVDAGCTDELAGGVACATGAGCCVELAVECDDDCDDACEPPLEWNPPPPPKPPPPPARPPPPPPCCASAAEGANSSTTAARMPTANLFCDGGTGLARVIFAPQSTDRDNRYA